MTSWRMESAATLLVLVTLIGIPLWVRSEEAAASRVPDEPGLHVIEITAVAAGGIFTFEDVVGQIGRAHV